MLGTIQAYSRVSRRHMLACKRAGECLIRVIDRMNIQNPVIGQRETSNRAHFAHSLLVRSSTVLEPAAGMFCPRMSSLVDPVDCFVY